MKIVFYHSTRLTTGEDGHEAVDLTNRELRIGEALTEGLLAHGDELIMIPKSKWKGPIPGTDAAMMFGVKSRKMFAPHIDAGIPAIYIDKGYLGSRGPEARSNFFKFSVNAIHPLSYFQSDPRPLDRLKRLKIKPQKWRHSGDHLKILVALSSQKYCTWHGQGDATKYAAKLIKAIHKETGGKRTIVYRPKPSWKAAVSIKDYEFSRPPARIRDALRQAHVLVTHGSNAAIDAILAGVPVVVLGAGIGRPIAGHTIKHIAHPYLPSTDVVHQWLRDIAYCQWSLAELKSGLAWGYIRKDIWRELRCR